MALVLLWNHLPYYYNNDKAVDFITSHAETKSKCSCAYYVIRGLWHGGCPVSLLVLPAYGYSNILPQMGFKEVSSENYTPQRGDISVLPQNSNHVSGILQSIMANNGCQISNRTICYALRLIGQTGNTRYSELRTAGIGSTFGLLL